MKRFLFLMMIIVCVGVISASTPAMPTFPAKYATWINHQRFEGCVVKLDFHNFETTFTAQVCGFDQKNYYGSWYGYKISKYMIAHRDLLNSYVPFYFSFLDGTSVKKKKILRNSMRTLRLKYDNKELELKDLIHISIFNSDKRISYYAMDFLGYLPKEAFIEISQAKKLILQFEIDGKPHKYDLQIPKIYEGTFKINN